MIRCDLAGSMLPTPASTGSALVGPAPGDHWSTALQALSVLSSAQAATEGLNSMLRMICRYTCQLTDTQRGFLFLRESSAQLFRGRVASDEVFDSSIRELTAGLPADRLTQEILTTLNPVLVSNVVSDPRPVRSTMRAYDVVSLLGIPMVVDDEVFGLLFVDNAREPLDLTASQIDTAAYFANVAATIVSQRRREVGLRKDVKNGVRVNGTLRDVLRLDDELMDLVAEGASAERVAGVFTRISTRSCVVHDKNFARIAVSLADGDLDVDISLLDAPLLDDPVTQEALRALDEGKEVVTTAHIHLPGQGGRSRFFLASLRARSDRMGYFVVRETRSGLGPSDVVAAQRVARAVALGLVVRRRDENAGTESREAFTLELLQGLFEPAALLERCRHVRFDLAQPRYVCFLTGARQEAGAPITPADVIAGCAGLVDDVLMCRTPDGLALVVAAADGGEPDHAAREVAAAIWRGCRPSGALIAIVSGPCLSPSDYRQAFADARQCASAVARHAGPDSGCTVFAVAEVLPVAPYLASGLTCEVKEHVLSVLAPLLENDRAALITTLAAYFANSRSIRRTAIALWVHENTVRYRLARAEHLLGHSFIGHAHVELKLEIALRIMRIISP